MIVKKNMLEKLLHQASFNLNGDSSEVIYGNLVGHWFPNCEIFWKFFVVPFTNRIHGYPDTLIQNISPRTGIAPEIEDIANTHYTNFLNLVYAHLHFFNDSLSSLENFYVHLGSVCDLTETFLEKWFFLLLKCRGDESQVLQQLSREDFLILAGDWYDKNYATIYENYLSKGKATPIKVPNRKNIIKELFQKYLKNEPLRKKYFQFSQSIRAIRNVIVHDIKIANIILEGQHFLPKPEVINNYRTWRKVFAAINDTEVFKKDFCLKKRQMYKDLFTLENILNEIWDLILKEFITEFYSEERVALRQMYDLQFENE